MCKGLNVHKGSFSSFTDRDAYLTSVSKKDIAWLRPDDETKLL